MRLPRRRAGILRGPRLPGPRAGLGRRRPHSAASSRAFAARRRGRPSASSASGQPGFFSSTAGTLAQPRGAHTATLLKDGRVLIAGGESPSGSLATAELYDPASGTFGPIVPMVQARAWQTATLLQDGRVLLVGGEDGSVVRASAELFNPATGKFAPAGYMVFPRTRHAATLLADGRVLITGGEGNAGVRASAELYDPATGSSPRRFDDLRPGRATATLLRDGRVLIAGGLDNSGAARSSAELYDPATGKFSQTGYMIEGREGQPPPFLPMGRCWSREASIASPDWPTGQLSCTTPTPEPSRPLGLWCMAATSIRRPCCLTAAFSSSGATAGTVWRAFPGRNCTIRCSAPSKPQVPWYTPAAHTLQRYCPTAVCWWLAGKRRRWPCPPPSYIYIDLAAAGLSPGRLQALRSRARAARTGPSGRPGHFDREHQGVAALSGAGRSLTTTTLGPGCPGSGQRSSTIGSASSEA